MSKQKEMLKILFEYMETIKTLKKKTKTRYSETRFSLIIYEEYPEEQSVKKFTVNEKRIEEPSSQMGFYNIFSKMQIWFFFYYLIWKSKVIFWGDFESYFITRLSISIKSLGMNLTEDEIKRLELKEKLNHILEPLMIDTLVVMPSNPIKFMREWL